MDKDPQDQDSALLARLNALKKSSVNIESYEYVEIGPGSLPSQKQD